MKSSSARHRSALLLIDVINDFDFPKGSQLLSLAQPAAHCIARLKERAVRAHIPVLYVNDNFGRWRSDFRQQVEHCLKSGGPGADLVQLLRPTKDDYFVLKPRHSGFYSTSLDVLLAQLKTHRLILTGFSTEICVIYTANDAYMRGFDLVVPADCVAAETRDANRRALTQIQKFLKADIRPSSRIRF